MIVNSLQYDNYHSIFDIFFISYLTLIFTAFTIEKNSKGTF